MSEAPINPFYIFLFWTFNQWKKSPKKGRGKEKRKGKECMPRKRTKALHMHLQNLTDLFTWSHLLIYELALFSYDLISDSL